MIDECFRTVEANDHLFNEDDEHRLMIDVSRGLLGIYQNIEGLHKGPNVIIADFPLRWTVATMGSLFESGINMVVTSQRAIPASLMDPKIKIGAGFLFNGNIEVAQSLAITTGHFCLAMTGSLLRVQATIFSS